MKTVGLKVWADRRSGPIGCLSGNAVLAVLQEQEGENIVHEKGTVFGTSKKLFVGRMCSSDQYLQKGIAHFCNMSIQQHEQMMEEKRELRYLFITVQGDEVHYWDVPGRVIGAVLPKLSAKPDGTTRFLRITEKDGKYFLVNKNITQYHKSITIKISDLKKLSKQAAQKNAAPSYRMREDGRRHPGGQG